MSDTQTIKDRIDIVQLIQEYIQLKKAGINWKANCPFHQEKTPSFMVNAEKQFWHCFGCGKSGDIFSFIQEMEGLEFPEALKLLADRAGVKIDTFRNEIDKSQKNRILEINQKAAYFFNRFLLEMAAASQAREYLSRRGLTSAAIEQWQIGYVPDQWDLLAQYLLKKGCGIEDIVQSGLVIKKDQVNAATGRGYYDRFRGRIMFPIWDVHGNVVGFTGRILVETDKSGGKYVNTPQTLVFDKSRVIYGLNKAKLEIKNKDLVVLVEGQMDVIACHQIGMTNVVAASGTALTLEQVKLLKRYSNNLAMAFDADAAGVKAAKRGVDVALEQGMSVKIIQIPAGGGKDADECIKKDKNVWLKAVQQAKEVMVWYFGINLSGLDLSLPKAKQLAAESLLVEIARLPYAIERDHWLKELSEKLSVDFSTLKEELKRLARRNSRRQTSQTVDDTTIVKIDSEPKNRYWLDLENLIGLFLKFNNLLPEYIDKLNPDYFVGTYLQDLYEKVLEQYNSNDKIDIKKLEETLAPDLKAKVDILLLKVEGYYEELEEKEIRRELDSILLRVVSEHRKRQLTKQVKI